MALDMKLKTLMAGKTPNPDFEGIETADDIVFAINTKPGTAEKVAEYVVGEVAVTGIDSTLNPEKQESTYLRVGKSSVKTGTQRTFKYDADRYIKDPFQEYCLGLAQATGQDVITDYVKFNIKNGKGEKGKVSIIVDKDGGGNAGEKSTVEIYFEQVAEKPVPYTWTDDSSMRLTTSSNEKESKL